MTDKTAQIIFLFAVIMMGLKFDEEQEKKCCLEL